MSETVPEQISGAEIWHQGTGQDPARYLVDPGQWNEGTKKMSAGQLAHARPWLDSGVRIFIWPVPTEGFSRSGQSMLALHHYIGDQFADAQVIHRDEARITLTGVFPGITAQNAMASLVNTLNDDPPDAGMVLNVPGVFDQVKFVIPENWEFGHDPDDQTHSISYTVTFIQIGERGRVSDPGGAAPPVNPSSVSANPSTTPSANVISAGGAAPVTPAQSQYFPNGFTTKSGVQTLKAIAFFSYGTPDRWEDVYNLNQELINRITKNAPKSKLPTYLLPVGVTFTV